MLGHTILFYHTVILKNVIWKNKLQFIHVNFHQNVCYLPPSGGPIREAIPWKRSKTPNALVNLSRPKRSTKITDVRPTYAPIVKPNTEAYIENVIKSTQ